MSSKLGVSEMKSCIETPTARSSWCYTVLHWHVPQQTADIMQIYHIVILVVNCVHAEIYHNEFAVNIPAGDPTASQIAEKYSYENLGQVSFIII